MSTNQLSFFITCILSLSGCGYTGDHTASGINIEGDIEGIALADVDTAWRAAAAMARVEPTHALDKHFITVHFVSAPIKCPTASDPGRLCGGLTTLASDYVLVYRFPQNRCVLGSAGSLIHEFFHILLNDAGVPGGDLNHEDPRWHEVNAMAFACTNP